MSELQELQNKEIEILQAIHDACEKLGLRYTLIFGSLLGAVRHKGFIPWDDDMDIAMPREDYDIFMEKGQQYLPENMRIQHYSTEPECPNIFAKVRDNTTTFLHREHIYLDINQGVFVDIFPVDRIKDSERSRKYGHKRRKLFDMLNGCYDKPYVQTIIHPAKRFVGWFIHYVIDSFVMIPSRNAFIRRDDLRRKKHHLDGDDCAYLCISTDQTIPYSILWDRVLLSFGDRQFYAPKEYDRILTETYGNYMQLPPEDKRITHKPLYMDLHRGLTKKEIWEEGIAQR